VARREVSASAGTGHPGRSLERRRKASPRRMVAALFREGTEFGLQARSSHYPTDAHPDFDILIHDANRRDLVVFENHIENVAFDLG